MDKREQIISKLDFLYINETELANSVCDILNCNYYRGGNESDPIGCYGCDEQEEIVASQEYRIVDKKTFDYINNYIIAETEKAKKDAVIETCNEITKIIDERTKFIGIHRPINLKEISPTAEGYLSASDFYKHEINKLKQAQDK